MSAMDIARIRRSLNGTLTELQRAIERFDVPKAADLFEWAWHQASQAPPRETREQRAQLKALKEVLGSRQWRDAERRLATQEQPRTVEAEPARQKRTKRPASEPEPLVRPKVVWSSDTARVGGQVPVNPSDPQATPAVKATSKALPVPARQAVQPLSRLGAGRLSELATDLRPLLEQTARAGATTTWTAIRKRLPALASVNRDDESLLLWLVDDERATGEPLLSALVTVGDRQMHPRFPAISEQLGFAAVPNGTQRSAWSYEVLKTHQFWRHRR
ncbi:hypothetical protein [Streptomyces rubiginosohelvolus]|uniref:Uncharacterized protein n=1 Tax=Streptomyces rubiginosohelvolus TaxID=67362 RepID=A0ABW6F755_9ACTN